VHPLAGLSFVATGCATSPGYAAVLHVVARHAIDERGGVTTTLLAAPAGADGAAPVTGTAEFIAEQGDALIFRTTMSDGDGPVTVLLTVVSPSAGELFATDGTEWVRAVVAIESLPAGQHDH
jgi:hypothetical protein